MARFLVIWLSLSLVLVGVGCGGTPLATQPVVREEPEATEAPASEVAVATPEPTPYALVEPAQEPVVAPGAEPGAVAWPDPEHPIATRSRSLRPFSSLRAVEQLARDHAEDAYGWNSYGGESVPMVASMTAFSDTCPYGSSNASSTSAAGGTESITSQQVMGIDEGDIVKRLEDHMVVLRQGVLYAISTEGTLRVQDRMVVQLPGESQGWIDELLVHERSRRLIVAGFVESDEGVSSTVYKLFTLGGDGRFVRGEALYMRSSDYYSSDNYATRLLGDDLVAYSVHELNLTPMPTREELAVMTEEDVAEARAEAQWDRSLPAMRTGETGMFRRIWDPRRVYRMSGSDGTILHAVTRCSLMTTPVTCSAHGVMANGEAELFVSHSAIYLFMSDTPFEAIPRDDSDDEALDEAQERLLAARWDVHPLYRIPHGAGVPQVVPLVGTPMGPLSFMESASALHVILDVSELTTLEGHPNAPLTALATIPLRDFGRRIPQHGDFRPLPGGAAEMVRFIGDDTLLYSAGDLVKRLFAHDLSTGTTQALYDGVGEGRIDPLSDQGAVVWWDEQVELRYLTVDVRATPRVTEHRRIPSSGTGETRTHGFFYRSDALGGSFGMPLVVTQGETRSLVAFFDVRDFRTQLVGELSSQPVAPQTCQQSCVDWYGNSRPIFWGERVFALLGPEVVEGMRFEGRIVESGRVVMTPPEP